MNQGTRISNHSNQGFTLIEAVVASALFAFVVSSILGVYMATLRLDTRNRAQRAVADNGRFIMEFLSKEIRNGHIDYGAIACNGSITEICLVNQDGDIERIYATDPVSLLSGFGTDLAIIKNGGASSNLNSDEIRITRLEFRRWPLLDPLTPGSKAAGLNEQPRVTVILELTGRSSRDPVKINLQSTFSESYYPSRE
jgi:type II secretory pathway pseudopilin PulG